MDSSSIISVTWSDLQIINNGCAYHVEGDVYFAVDKYPNYGRLSGRRLEDNRAGERVAVDERKQNPADFALWKVKRACQNHFLSFLVCTGLTHVNPELFIFL